jgi:hypothetical protein
VQVQVDVPAEKNIALSGLAVGIDGVTPAALQPDAFAGVIPFQPVTARAFVPSDTLRLFGHVYWKNKNATPTVTMTVSGPSGAVTSTPSLVPQKPAGDQQDAVIAAMLPLNGLAAGKYHLGVSATLPGGKPVTRDVLFEVR